MDNFARYAGQTQLFLQSNKDIHGIKVLTPGLPFGPEGDAHSHFVSGVPLRLDIDALASEQLAAIQFGLLV